MTNQLNPKKILALRAQAHHLHPVVMIGQQGLTDSIINETNIALNAHELIKIRILGDDRSERANIALILCQAVDAQLIQHIGKLLILYRKKPE